MEMSGLEEHRVYRVGLRKPLLLGCDRKLLLFVALFAFLLVYVGFPSPFYIGFGVSLWLFMLPVMRRIAKVDPFMTEKVVRHLFYIKQKAYRAHATPFANSKIYHN